MATMRESTSLLMAVSENGQNMPEHTWAVPGPPSRKTIEQEKRRGQIMMAVLAVLLTVSVLAVVFFFFLPSKSTEDTRRRTLERLNGNPEWKGLMTGEMMGDADCDDAMNSFTSSIGLKASGKRAIKESTQALSDLTSLLPSVAISGDENELHTMVMVEVSAESSWWPWARQEYLHWLVVDIPGNSDINEGRTVIHYEPPQWRGSSQKFVLALFKQPTTSSLVGGSCGYTRRQFQTKTFVKKHGLGLAVGASQFELQDESMKAVFSA